MSNKNATNLQWYFKGPRKCHPRSRPTKVPSRRHRGDLRDRGREAKVLPGGRDCNDDHEVCQWRRWVVPLFRVRLLSLVRPPCVRCSKYRTRKYDIHLRVLTSVLSAAASPHSWEGATGENPVLPASNESCLTIIGSKGSISVPDL